MHPVYKDRFTVETFLVFSQMCRKVDTSTSEVDEVAEIMECVVLGGVADTNNAATADADADAVDTNNAADADADDTADADADAADAADDTADADDAGRIRRVDRVGRVHRTDLNNEDGLVDNIYTVDLDDGTYLFNMNAFELMLFIKSNYQVFDEETSGMFSTLLDISTGPEKNLSSIIKQCMKIKERLADVISANAGTMSIGEYINRNNGYRCQSNEFNALSERCDKIIANHSKYPKSKIFKKQAELLVKEYLKAAACIMHDALTYYVPYDNMEVVYRIYSHMGHHIFNDKIRLQLKQFVLICNELSRMEYAKDMISFSVKNDINRMYLDLLKSIEDM